MSEVLLARRCKLTFREQDKQSAQVDFIYDGPPVEIVELGLHLHEYPGYFSENAIEKTSLTGKLFPLEINLQTPRGTFSTQPLLDGKMALVNFENENETIIQYGLALHARSGGSVAFKGANAILIDPGDAIGLTAIRPSDATNVMPATTLWMEIFGEKALF